MVRCGLVAIAVWAAGSGGVAAHPHIFVDAGVEVMLDAQDRAVAVKVTWAYDDLFSLMIVEDRDMDADFDGVLTPEETAAIQGFDMQWDAGYAGDTYALQGGVPLPLSGPSDWTTTYVDGRLISTHLRRLVNPAVVTAQPLVVQVYDPSFYTAYTIAQGSVTGGGAVCAAQAYEPDRAAADRILQDAIAEQAGSADIEGAFPAIGAAYAEELRVTCAAQS